jgi:hypothetical protein
LAKVIKQLKGHSMSKVELMQKDGQTLVRKTGGIGRNIERYDALSRLRLPIPKILEVYGDSYDMEYIQHEDMKTFLTNHNVTDLAEFLKHTIDSLLCNTIEKDYSKTYDQKLSVFPWERYDLPFDAQQLYAKLPKVLPSSEYHGDLTLENILYRTTGDFVLIDPLTTEYDSYVFDLAKLRQDITCKWFIRGERFYFESKLRVLNDTLKTYHHYNEDYLLILMLMRVLPYTYYDADKEFVESEIRKLWK